MHRFNSTQLKDFILALFTLFLFCPAGYGEGFPGKGDASAWSDALPHYNLGNRYLATERYDDAARKFSDAIEIYQFDPDFYSNLGLAYCKAGHYVEAEQAFKKALGLNDKDWMLWSNLAAAYLKQDRLTETLSTFDKALKCHPPQSEQSKIHTDIKDIKKILTAQGLLPVQAQKKQQAISPKSTNTKKVASSAKLAKPLNKGVFVQTPVSVTDKQYLKKSGWDYLN